MNLWTKLSVEYANHKSYLDDLFKVYPFASNVPREIDSDLWERIKEAFSNKDNAWLVESILALPLAPIKDSYLSYLRRDPSAIARNPNTVNRLAGMLYDLGLEEMFKRSIQPKETNRQMGSLFNNWLMKGTLGAPLLDKEAFGSTTENAVLVGSDTDKQSFAKERLRYSRNKGLDFVARFNGRYVIGEAKFLTDFGGHQDAQLNDAMDTLKTNCKAVILAILDGVIYIPSKSKMHRSLESVNKPDRVILSALLLRDFLYQL